MIIHFKDATVRGKGEIEIRNYITKEISGSFSLAVSTLDGIHPGTINTASDRAYYIIEGEGVVMVGDEEGAVKAGDAVYIPKNTVHAIHGKVKYVVVNAPSYDSSYEAKPHAKSDGT